MIRNSIFAKIRKKDLIYCILVLLYFLSNLYISFFHEPWRDESQAWVLSHNLGWMQIHRICASEGHPVLWFYLVKLIIMAGIPFRFFSLLSIILMTIALIIMLWGSKLSMFSKIAITLSPLFFYYDPVICRIYSVIMLLICWLCTVWEKRHLKPILYGVLTALLFQTHVLVAGVAIGCVIDMVMEFVSDKDRRNLRHLFGIIIPGISLLLLILELKQSHVSETYIKIDPGYVLNRLNPGRIFDSILSIGSRFNYDTVSIGWVFLLFVFCISVLCLVLFFAGANRGKNLRTVFVSICGIAVYMGIIVMVRASAHIQMSIVLWIIALFLCWTLQTDKKTVVFEILLVAVCAVFIPKTLLDGQYDIKNAYSGSKEIAELITDTAGKGSVIILNNDPLSTSVVAYLSDYPDNYTIWDINNKREYTIHKWGESSLRSVNDANVMGYISSDICGFPEDAEVYYVQSSMEGPVILQYADNVVSIGGNTEINRKNEYYWLYRVR